MLRSFLLSGPTTLSPEEVEDARRREESDQIRDEGRKRFAKEVASRIDVLREAIKTVKGDIMGKGKDYNRRTVHRFIKAVVDGLTTIFATIKVTPNMTDLPPNYLSVIEWGRISFVRLLCEVHRL